LTIYSLTHFFDNFAYYLTKSIQKMMTETLSRRQPAIKKQKPRRSKNFGVF